MFSTWMVRIKMAAMTALTAGMLFGPGCSVTDIRDNVVAGSLGFVKTYTGQVLDLLVPDANVLFPPQG